MSATLLDPAALAAPAPALATAPRARWARRSGRALSRVAVLFLAVDAAMQLVASPEALAGTTQLGWRAEHMPVLAALQAACLVLYLVPRTAVLGAVLWTGYLGGAIATHLRVDNPLFSHLLFPIYVAALIWGGLYLRDDRVRALLRPTR